MARGFVRKRGDTWYAYWRDQTGKQKAKAIGPRKKDAEAYLVQVQKEVNENTFREIRKIGFSDFAAKWVEDYAEVQVKPSTLKNYRCVIDGSLVPYFGNVPLQSIVPSDVQGYVTQRIKSGRSAQTAKKNLVLLKLMLKWAVEWGYLKTNPAQSVKPPKTEQREMEFLTPAEIRVFLQELQPEWRPFFHTAIFTGMRLGELLGLQWCDIDFENAAIHVRHSLWGGRLQEPKTKSSVRTIGMPPSLNQVLKDHRATALTSDSVFVFCDENGHHPSVTHLRLSVFEPALKRAGIKRIRLHDLRHTFASLLINQGENLKYVQNQLGHSSITTTVDRYGHLMPDVRKSAGERLDATVFSAA